MNKTAFITGANKGIGFGISKHLGMSGWNIVFGARDEQRAKAAIAELKALGVNVLGWVSIELADLNCVAQCAETIKKDYIERGYIVCDCKES